MVLVLGEQNPESLHAPIILLDVVFIIFSFAKQLLKHPRNTLRGAVPRRSPHRSPHCRCPPLAVRARPCAAFSGKTSFGFLNFYIIECSDRLARCSPKLNFLSAPTHDMVTVTFSLGLLRSMASPTSTNSLTVRQSLCQQTHMVIRSRPLLSGSPRSRFNSSSCAEHTF